jgi:adenylate cyclase
MEYTVIGDTVNTASRLESFDKTIAAPNREQPCRILIGETTHAYVRHLCECQEIGEFYLKGKHRPSTIYQVLSSLGD